MRVDAYVRTRKKDRLKRQIYLWGGAGFIALYLIVVAVMWFFLRSPFFKVQHVVVTGNAAVSSDQVVALLEADALKGGSFTKALLGFDNLLAWPKTIPSDELRLVPGLASVSVDKDYFSNTLTANVAERSPAGIWCFMPRFAEESIVGAKQCYWFDNAGIIFGRALDTEGGLVFTIEDRSQKPTGLNLTILPARFTPNLISILNVLHASGLSVRSISLDDLSREEITVTTNGGPDLYFSLRFPADNYLPVVKALRAEAGFAKIQYIDCRTENRVFYK